MKSADKFFKVFNHIFYKYFKHSQNFTMTGIPFIIFSQYVRRVMTTVKFFEFFVRIGK